MKQRALLAGILLRRMIRNQCLSLQLIALQL